MKYLVDMVKDMGGVISPISNIEKKSSIYFPMNATVAVRKGEVIIDTRLCNYLYMPWVNDAISMQRIFKEPDPNKIIYSYNEIGTFDGSFHHKQFIDPGKGPFNFWNMYAGLEDMRLVTWNDTLYGICARPDVISNKVIQQLIEFDDSFNISRTWLLSTKSRIEKGWLPIEDKPFTFMYDIGTQTSISFNIDLLMQNELNELEVPQYSGKFSGSTPLIRYKDGYVCICHNRIDYTENTEHRHVHYEHKFVVLNDDLSVRAESVPFKFLTDGIEYTCGLCHYNDKVLLTFSVGDSNCHLMEIPNNIFETIVDDSLDGFKNHPDRNEPTNYFIENYTKFLDCDALAVAMGYLPKDNTVLMYNTIKKLDERYDFLKDNKSIMTQVINRMIIPAYKPYQGLYELLNKLK